MLDIIKRLITEKTKTDEIECEIEKTTGKFITQKVGKFNTTKVGKFVKEEVRTGVRIQQR